MEESDRSELVIKYSDWILSDGLVEAKQYYDEVNVFCFEYQRQLYLQVHLEFFAAIHDNLFLEMPGFGFRPCFFTMFFN